jgi:ribosomal protein S18 acetylase RimI-like enzyme
MLRRAGAGDLPQLLGLVAEYCAADGHAFEADRVRAALLPLLADDAHGQVWVHVRADGPDADGPLGESSAPLDGYIVTAWSWSLESGGRECLVDELYVRDRRLGHGRELVERALVAARAHGCRVAFLETEAANDGARSFYQRLGFGLEDSVWLSRPLD